MGRPVAVVPMMADTTVCIAASYEAKAHGVKTGTVVADAKRMCPDLVLVEARHELYVDYHHRIVEAVESCLPVTAVLSIDEMACRLMGRERPLLAAMELGRKVKARDPGAGGADAAEFGGAGDQSLPGQGGQRHGKAGRAGGAAAGYFAGGAAAADAARPARDWRADREAAERQGHSTRMERLAGAAIANRPASCGDRCGASGCGTGCRGEDFDMSETEHLKSISHQHVLAPEMRTPEKAWAVAHKLLHKAAMRLRAGGLWASSIGLAIGFAVPRGREGPVSNFGVPDARMEERAEAERVPG